MPNITSAHRPLITDINQNDSNKANANQGSTLLNSLKSVESDSSAFHQFIKLPQVKETETLFTQTAMEYVPDSLRNTKLDDDGEHAKFLLGILAREATQQDKKTFDNICKNLLKSNQAKISESARNSAQENVAKGLNELISKHGQCAFSKYLSECKEHCRQAWCYHHNCADTNVADEDIFDDSFLACHSLLTGQIKDLIEHKYSWVELTEKANFILCASESMVKTLKFHDAQEPKKAEEPGKTDGESEIDGPQLLPHQEIPASGDKSDPGDRSIHINVEGSKAHASVGSKDVSQDVGSTSWDFGRDLIKAEINEKEKIGLLKDFLARQFSGKPPEILSLIEQVTPFDEHTDASSLPDSMPDVTQSIGQRRGSADVALNRGGKFRSLADNKAISVADNLTHASSFDEIDGPSSDGLKPSQSPGPLTVLSRAESPVNTDGSAPHSAALTSPAGMHTPASLNTDRPQMAGTEATAADILAKTESLARWIATDGNWLGGAGDFAPALMTRLYPNVTLHINMRDVDGQLISTVSHATEGHSADRQVALDLQNQHYSPVINGEPQSVPADGNCFFHSFLFALNERAPSGEDITALRNEVADYIRNRRDDIADFINDELLDEIDTQDRMRAIASGQTGEAGVINVFTAGAPGVGKAGDSPQQVEDGVSRREQVAATARAPQNNEHVVDNKALVSKGVLEELASRFNAVGGPSSDGLKPSQSPGPLTVLSRAESPVNTDGSASHSAALTSPAGMHTPASLNTDRPQMAGTEATAADVLAKTESLERWIATDGNWLGGAGDFAPALMTRLYPNVTLHINMRDVDGQLISTVSHATEGHSADRQVALDLQNQHYSPVINGEPQSVPADGNCFFHSFLFALNERAPSGEDITALRNEVADYIRNRRDDIADFINDELLDEIDTQDRMRAIASGQTGEAGVINGFTAANNALKADVTEKSAVTKSITADILDRTRMAAPEADSLSFKPINLLNTRLFTTWNTVDVFNRRNSKQPRSFVPVHTSQETASLERQDLEQAFVALARKPITSAE